MYFSNPRSVTSPVKLAREGVTQQGKHVNLGLGRPMLKGLCHRLATLQYLASQPELCKPESIELGHEKPCQRQWVGHVWSCAPPDLLLDLY